MSPLGFCPPFLVLALVALGARLGGGWTFAAFLAAPLCLAGLDAALGDDTGDLPPRGEAAYRQLPLLYVLLQLAVTGWLAVRVSRVELPALEFIGLVLSNGLATGIFGFVAAHELIHSRRPGERAAGLVLLGSAFYMHFAIAHVHGHHRRAATRDDPASARLGESLYAFLPRSIAGQLAESWAFEAQRLRRRGRAVAGPGNRVLIYLALEGLLALAVGLASLRALGFLAAGALVAILLLEAFNYIAHYGLARDASGRVERLGPKHAWNTARRINNRALFNMGRHSDHHGSTMRPYHRLETPPGAPQLPAGYAGMILLALVPPLWRRVMDPRARAVGAASSGPGTFTASP